MAEIKKRIIVIKKTKEGDKRTSRKINKDKFKKAERGTCIVEIKANIKKEETRFEIISAEAALSKTVSIFVNNFVTFHCQAECKKFEAILSNSRQPSFMEYNENSSGRVSFRKIKMSDIQKRDKDDSDFIGNVTYITDSEAFDLTENERDQLTKNSVIERKQILKAKTIVGIFDKTLAIFKKYCVSTYNYPPLLGLFANIKDYKKGFIYIVDMQWGL